MSLQCDLRDGLNGPETVEVLSLKVASHCSHIPPQCLPWQVLWGLDYVFSMAVGFRLCSVGPEAFRL